MTKNERKKLKQKYGGQCAYCGEPLGEKWHADHLEPIHRNGYADGPPLTERDTIENMMPACAPCNIDKATRGLEDWRQKLQNGPDVLMRNSPTYRHAVRFGLLGVQKNSVSFYFENWRE